MVSLDRCDGSCNTMDDPSSIMYVLNRTGDKNLSVFKMERKRFSKTSITVFVKILHYTKKFLLKNSFSLCFS